MPEQITKGSHVMARDAGGAWRRMIAVSGPMRGVDFAVVWLATLEDWTPEMGPGSWRDGETKALPWPLTDVVLAPENSDA